MSAPKIVTAAILVIGNEILSGRTRDANLNFLAGELTALGIRLMEARIVPDIEAEIVAALNALRRRYDYVFTTGGIGPTHDDITADAIAKAFGIGIDFDPAAVAVLKRHYGDGNLTEARLRMARLPAGATMIDNPVSAAPGIAIENVFVLAGVPAIAQAMFHGLKARLKGGDPVFSRVVSAYIGEGVIARDLGDLAARHADLDIGSYPYFRQGKFGASFVIRGTERARIDAAAAELQAIIRRLGAEPIDGEPAA